MSYTKDQEAIVLQILAHKPTNYYKILDSTTSSTDIEIKKSYRKLAIKLHPDKNPHPRASEAFKIINKSFEVLGDPAKKRIFDQTGSDPDSRYEQAASSSSHSAHNHPFNQFNMNMNQGMPAGFENDIFNMFFGGGAGGAQTFTFGNDGFSFNIPNQQFRQRAERTHTPETPQRTGETTYYDIFKQILPILLFILFPIISNLFTSSEAAQFSFIPTKDNNIGRTSGNYGVQYFTSQENINNYFKDNKDKNTRKKSEEFEKKIENKYIQNLRHSCSKEQNYKNEMINDAYGFFFVDQEKLRIAEEFECKSCNKLAGFGLL